MVIMRRAWKGKAMARREGRADKEGAAAEGKGGDDGAESLMSLPLLGLAGVVGKGVFWGIIRN